ncbi:MAG: AzlD domain-containing protein [Anaerolineae bacterium]|nr:AzlD domain-containing protein [Anaerolineae bacterium]
MSNWLIIAGMVAVTYSVRLSVIALLGDAAMPPSINRALRYVPPAALTAIIVPAVIMPDGSLDVSPGNARLLAALVAAVVAWTSKSAIIAIGAGMAMLWLMQWVM